MDRRQVLAGSALLPAAFAARSLGAKTSSLRDRLLGSWKLLEPVTIDKATGTRSVWDNRPGPYSGMIAYISNGTMCVHIGSARAVTTKGWEELSSAERLAAADTWYGYFGRFEVDEAKQQVRHFVTGSLQPDEIGRTLVRNVKIAGNLVTLTTETAPDAKSYNQLTWERI